MPKDFELNVANALESTKSLLCNENVEEVGVQGFIQDEYASEKSKNRLRLDVLIKDGILKSTDASVFHCLNKKLTVKFSEDA